MHSFSKLSGFGRGKVIFKLGLGFLLSRDFKVKLKLSFRLEPDLSLHCSANDKRALNSSCW